jgi:hypothetical protein
MPAPQAYVPTPKDARVLPALTEATAQQFSDQYLASLGYPPRPDATASRNRYAKWLDRVSRPMTLLPPHLVSNSNTTRRPRRVEAGTSPGTKAGPETAPGWSGLEARGKSGSYRGVDGIWNVPSVTPAGPSWMYSTFWIGLDGDCIDPAACNDRVQDGTEQDCLYLGPGSYAYNYYAWTELLPNQPVEQVISSLSNINPGDKIQAEVWIGDSNGALDVNGHYASDSPSKRCQAAQN